MAWDMYEEVIVPCDFGEGNGHTDRNIEPRMVIFANASRAHILITVVDPRNGVSAEVMVRKDALPAFVTKHKD